MARSVIVKNFLSLLAVCALAVGAAPAQSLGTSAASQTARQALIEMFFSKTPGTLVKHLPAVTLSALEKSGALTTLQQYSMLAGQFQAKGKTFETFDTGSVLLAAADPQAGTKFEIAVEKDSLQGEEDDIELSFHTHKDDQLQRTPFLPRMTFAMKMESGVWTLNEILVTVRLPLSDPDFLKSITEGLKSRSAATAPMPTQIQTSTTTFGSDASVLTAMRTILTAENTYLSAYPAVGFTCTLSDLDGFGAGQPNEHQAMLIASGLASGKKFGYVFSLSGCTGTPATSFHLVAAPSGNSFGRRAFCSDQSGAIRYSADGQVATCLASGSAAQ
jgi:hypothetical protein